MRQLIVVLTLSLGGCNGYPASLVSLCEDAESLRDDRIVGEWRLETVQQTDQRKGIVSLGEIPASASLVVSRDSTSRYSLVLRNEETAVPFTGRLARIGDELFLDLQHAPLDDPALRGTTIRPYFLVRCAIADGRIRLTGFDPSEFRRIIEEESLPLIEIDSKAVYAGTTAQLRDLLSRRSSDLFPRTRGDVVLSPRSSRSTDDELSE